MKILTDPTSGSYAGITASRNRFGQYRRSRSIPVNPQSPAQVAVRANFATFTKGWQVLTSDQQDQWAVYAAAHPKQDRLGQTIVLSGQQSYIGFNSRLAAIGVAPVLVPPASGGIAPLLVPEVTGTALSITDELSVDFTNDQAVTATATITVFATPAKSQGVNFAKDYFLIGSLNNEATSGDQFPYYATKFGAPPVGKRVFIKTVVTGIDGIQYGTATFKVTVGA